MERIAWIDNYRGILFILVILSHCYNVPSIYSYIYEPIFLTGFFMLSGILYKKKLFRDNIVSIFNGLVLPYIIYAILVSLINVFIYKENVSMIFNELYTNFVLGGDRLWFIPCLILVELFYVIVDHVNSISHKNIYLFTISCALFICITSVVPKHLPWNIDTAAWVLMYFILGISIKNIINKISKKTSFIYLIISIIISLLFGLLTSDKYRIDIHMNVVTFKLPFIVLSIFSPVATMLFVKNYINSNSQLTKLGQYTLFSFAFHGYIYLFIMFLLRHSFSGKLLIIANIYIYISTLLITIIIGVVLIIICNFLNKYCPLLLGKYKLIK